MLDPFPEIAHAGLGQREVRVHDTTQTWSAELITQLDWLRVAELARAISEHHGCALARSCVLENGTVIFGMTEAPGTTMAQRVLVKIAGWNEWGATAERVAQFGQELQSTRRTRGVLIAPGGFSSGALMAAQEFRIEMVDATTLATVLTAMPAERRDLLLSLATSGNYMTPSCPVCLEKLEQVDVNAQEPPLTRVITQSGLIAEHVHCQFFEVAAGCEATFLHEVRAREMRISGHACGDFRCDGQVILEPGGMLTGTVTAKAIDVQEGGELRGQFRVLDGRLESFVETPPRWQWRCRNYSGKAACANVMLEPHGEMDEKPGGIFKAAPVPPTPDNKDTSRPIPDDVREPALHPGA